MFRKLLVGSALFMLSLSLFGEGPNGRGDPHVFRIVDKNDKLVGYTVTDNVVTRQIGDIWVSFYVHPALGVFDSEAMYVYYLTPDCTGTQYVPRYRVFSEGIRVGSKLYYPTDFERLTMQSTQIITEQPAVYDTTCYHLTGPNTYVYSRISKVAIESFGFELPFKATQ